MQVPRDGLPQSRHDRSIYLSAYTIIRPNYARVYSLSCSVQLLPVALHMAVCTAREEGRRRQRCPGICMSFHGLALYFPRPSAGCSRWKARMPVLSPSQQRLFRHLLMHARERIICMHGTVVHGNTKRQTSPAAAQP
jgi:hypothetical protein